MTYIPPVIIEVTGEDSGFLAMLAKDRAALAAFAAQVADPTISADDAPLAAKAADAEAALRTLGAQKATPTVTLNDAGFRASVAADMAALKALSDARTSIGAQAVSAYLASGGQDQATLLALSQARTSAGASGLAAMLGLSLAGAGGGGGGGGGGASLLGALGWGTGGLMGMAKFGSLLSLMGFGGEHLIATGVGVGGSLAGAGIGAGLLGLGMGGTMAVGMGTDMAGMGQAAGDIKSTLAVLTQYNSLQQQLARQLPQTAAGQQALNAALAGFAPVAQGAVLNAALTAGQFHAMFDYATGEAEKIGAQILNQAMQVGMKFLPTIGKYAAENMSIIQKDIQPLFTWLQNPAPSGGLGIFTNLEQLFQNQLPTAMKAMTNGFELLAKTIDIAAQYGGKFITWIADFVTKMNTVDFGKWSNFVRNMIGLFETWFHLGIQLGQTIYDLFLPAVGLGQAFAATLTGIFKQIDSWLTSVGMSNVLHNLFSAHLQELITGIGGALQAALPFVEGFAQAFLQVLAAGAQVISGALQPLTQLLRTLTTIPFATTVVGWGVALGIAYKAFMAFIQPLGEKLGLVAADTSALATETKVQTDAMAASWDRYAAAVSESTGIAKKDIESLKAQTMMSGLVGGGGATPLLLPGGGNTIQRSELGTPLWQEGGVVPNSIASLKNALAFNKAGTTSAGLGLLSLNIGTYLLNQTDQKYRKPGTTLGPAISAGTDIASGAGAGAVIGTTIFPGLGTATGAVLGALAGGAMAFRTQLAQGAVQVGHDIGSVGHHIGTAFMSAWHSLFGGGPSKQQEQHTQYLAQIATNIASIRALGAKDVSIQGVKAAVAANNLAHSKGLSNQTLHVVDDATKQMATLGAKNQALMGLVQQVQAMKQEYGANSPQERQAVQLLENTAKTWFPQLSKDKTIGQMSKSITTQEKALYEKSAAAQINLAAMQQLITALTNGQGVKALQSEVAKDKSILSVLQAEHATKSEIATEKSILSNAESNLKQVQAAQKNIAQDKTIISTAAKQYSELQALKAGLTAAVNKVDTTLNEVHTLTGSATLKVS